MKQVTYMNQQYICDIIYLPDTLPDTDSSSNNGLAVVGGRLSFFFPGLDALSAKDRRRAEKFLEARLGFPLTYKNSYCGYNFISRPF